MPFLPAFCDHCGQVFPGMEVPSASLLTASENRVSCPRCGSLARVLEGTMNVYKDTIEILHGTSATAAQLARLQELLRDAQQKQRPPEEVAAAVERELPNFGALARQLLIPKTPADFYSVVTVIIASISLLKDHPPAPTPYVDRSVHQTTIVQSTPSPPATAYSVKPAPNVGRNVPCPCGSGKKYKHCCGGIR